MIKTSALLAACAALTLAAPAFAAPTNTMTADAKPAATAKVTAPAKVKGPATTPAKTAEGKACSAEADAKGLHGKARKNFRSKCKEEAKPAAEAGAAVKADAKATAAATKKP